MTASIPVITLDGPSGVCKGTIGKMLASRLNWHFLDSGVLYRVLAWEAAAQGISLENEEALADLATQICPTFRIITGSLELEVAWRQQDLTHLIRQEALGEQASKLAVYPKVRDQLLDRQRAFRQPPGLVADGRDMGSIVFPDATCKFFLTASLEARAKRRYSQLKQQENHASLDKFKAAILQRDERDQTRSVAALKATPEAVILDTTTLSIEQAFSMVWNNL